MSEIKMAVHALNGNRLCKQETEVCSEKSLNDSKLVNAFSTL